MPTLIVEEAVAGFGLKLAVAPSGNPLSSPRWSAERMSPAFSASAWSRRASAAKRSSSSTSRTAGTSASKLPTAGRLLEHLVPGPKGKS